MTQPVKLHILSPDHTGPVVYVADQLPTQEFVQDGPPLRAALHPDANARMAIFKGTLYTDTEPLEWNAVDADRAAALGYGPSDPWPEFPAPDLIKPGPVTQYLTPKVDSMIRMDPAQQLKALKEARRNKVNLLDVHIKPRFIASFESNGVRIDDQLRPGAFAFDFYVFDSLTIGQLVNRIQTRLQ